MFAKNFLRENYKRSSTEDKKKQKVEWLRKCLEFFQGDDFSGMFPGKKYTLIFRKIKRQKGYLCDTLKNLHKKFIATKKTGLFILNFVSLCKRYGNEIPLFKRLYTSNKLGNAVPE